MKKKIFIAVGLLALLLVASPAQTEAYEGRGGIGGLLVGCCFGVRTAGAFNEGKDLHFREWARIIPYVGAIFAIWDGIEGAQGVTTSQLRQTYGALFY